MEWRVDSSPTSYLNNSNEEDEEGARSDGMKYVLVMTDEQIEILRRQIAAYIVISEGLVEMYKKSQMAGMNLGSPYSDMLLTSGGYKISARQRWSPTVGQLEILDRIFEQENGARSKEMIKQLTSELSRYGPVTETNVYNWFQNRRARSKRKQTAASSNNESEFEADIDTSVDKRTKSDNNHSTEDQPPRREENSSPNQEVVSELHAKDKETRIKHPSNGSSKNSGSSGQTSSRDNNPNTRRNQTRDGRDGLSWGPYSVFQEGNDIIG